MTRVIISRILAENKNKGIMKAQTIWKFPLESKDMQIIDMPIGAEILCVQAQHNDPCLWAQVDPDAKGERRYIYIFGTGHPMTKPPMDTEMKYIDTYQMDGGRLVFHVYENVAL